MLRRTILPLRPLPLILQNLYIANPDNFSHNSHQYNSLFTFTILGYMGGVVRLLHPHAFAVNGRAYHQVYSASAKGYPTNWFVYDADARDDIVNQRSLNQKIVNLIKCELAAVNPFVEGLRQLYNVNYPRARLIIQQPTNNAKVAACTIVHSTAVIQERSVHIWHVGEENPTYISILDENYEALQYPLFFPQGEIGWRMYWIDPEHSTQQKISQKKNYENDETIYDEANLFSKNIYLPASHTLSYRWSYKKMMDALAVRGLPHAHIIIKSSPNLLGPNSIDKVISAKLPVGDNIRQSHLRDLYIYKGPDRASVTVRVGETDEIIDEIKDYINACYLSAMKASLPPNTYLEKKQEGCQQQGMAAQFVWQNHHKLLSADYISKKEEHGSRITQFGLPQPSNHLDEIIRVQSQYCDNAALIMARDEMIWRLNFEQSENYESCGK
ncbi:hypothetical protein C2G38_2195050 [Gigaspora rosea]|uniref:Uncharacterized protein n=1 Tax=Gigaspora rosea TaxID=44941 RepID=A0A397UW41_9GLOM|nr:hypothetical protein C2G38_2195050 [Gigaspora rosea]